MSKPCNRNAQQCAQDNNCDNGAPRKEFGASCCAGRPKSSCAADKDRCTASPIDANPCKKSAVSPSCCPAKNASCCPAKNASCCPAKNASCCPAKSNCPPSKPSSGSCCKPTARLDTCCTAVKTPMTKSCQDPANDCMNCDLTDFGKQHAANTGKLIQNCTCVKFNGLQDFCTHSGCNSTRKGCTDNPFPSCLPAQKWKCDFICKNRKKPDQC